MRVALVKVLVGAAQPFQRAGHLAHGLVVGAHVAHRVDRLAFVGDGVPLAAAHVHVEVLEFQGRGGGQDDVGEQAVVLHPGVLHEHELEVRMTQRILELMAAVPAGGPAGRVGPDHADALARLGRVLERDELVGAINASYHMAVPFYGRLGDGLVDHGLGDERLAQIHRGTAVGALGRGQHAARRQRVERLHVHELPFDHLELVHARLAHAAHAQQVHLHARRFVRERRADVAAAVAVGDGHLVLCPVARERLDAVVGHAAALGRPRRRLRHAVLAAQHVVLEPVEAHAVRVEVFFLVGALGHPHVGDSQLQRHVGVRQHGDPLVGVHGRGVVAVGRHEHRQHAYLVEPVAQTARHLAAPAPRRGLGIGAPVEDGVAVLGDVLDHVRGDGLHAHRIHAPGVLGAPVPALPAVGLAGLLEEAARQVQQVRLAAVGGMDVLRLAVAVGLGQDGERTGFLLNALDLGGDEVACLVPRDAHVLRRAAVLGVALAVRVPVHALERVRDAVRRVGARLVRHRERRRVALHARLQHVPACLDLPRVQLLGRVELVVVQRADARHAPVLHVDFGDVGTHAEAAKAKALDNRFVGGLV